MTRKILLPASNRDALKFLDVRLLRAITSEKFFAQSGIFKLEPESRYQGSSS